MKQSLLTTAAGVAFFAALFAFDQMQEPGHHLGWSFFMGTAVFAFIRLVVAAARVTE